MAKHCRRSHNQIRRYCCQSVQLPQISSFKINEVQKNAQRLFEEHWEKDRKTNRKLGFYNDVKTGFYLEPYLQLKDGIKVRAVAKMRMSAHRLRIETGRYGAKRDSTHNRACLFCSTEDLDVLQDLSVLPFSDPIIEDEYHVLLTCPKYYHRRIPLDDMVKSALFRDIKMIFSTDYIAKAANFIQKILKDRFPAR